MVFFFFYFAKEIKSMQILSYILGFVWCFWFSVFFLSDELFSVHPFQMFESNDTFWDDILVHPRIKLINYKISFRNLI